MTIGASIFAMPANGEVVYRAVRTGQSRVEDFRSHRERPRKRPVAPGTPWLLLVGVSMFDTYDGALQIARRRPAWIAELRLANDAGIHLAATGLRGHRTVWGDPRVLAACVATHHLAP